MAYSIEFAGLSNITRANIADKYSQDCKACSKLLAISAVVGAIVLCYFTFISHLSIVTIGIFIGMEIADLTAMLYCYGQSLLFEELSDAYRFEVVKNLSIYLIAAYVGLVVLVGFAAR